MSNTITTYIYHRASLLMKVNHSALFFPQMYAHFTIYPAELN